MSETDARLRYSMLRQQGELEQAGVTLAPYSGWDAPRGFGPEQAEAMLGRQREMVAALKSSDEIWRGPLDYTTASLLQPGSLIGIGFGVTQGTKTRIRDFVGVVLPQQHDTNILQLAYLGTCAPGIRIGDRPLVSPLDRRLDPKREEFDLGLASLYGARALDVGVGKQLGHDVLDSSIPLGGAPHHFEGLMYGFVTRGTTIPGVQSLTQRGDYEELTHFGHRDEGLKGLVATATEPIGNVEGVRVEPSPISVIEIGFGERGQPIQRRHLVWNGSDVVNAPHNPMVSTQAMLTRGLTHPDRMGDTNDNPGIQTLQDLGIKAGKTLHQFMYATLDYRGRNNMLEEVQNL